MFAVAPMMDWTDRHCRAFHRAFSRRAVLFTEMVTADAVLHGDQARLLSFSEAEHPVVLQLGGSEPEKLAAAARIGAAWGYDALNLNVGCPSERVQSGAFGACLMREPTLVAECLAAMAEAAPGVPVSIKHRLGVDEQDPEQTLFPFVEAVAHVGVREFIVHARKAWLKGLSPKDNREIPPLDYPLVRRLKAAFPELAVVLNGGLETLGQARTAAGWGGPLPPGEAPVDGVMLGRAAYHTPEILGHVDAEFYGATERVGAAEALARYRPYMAAALGAGTPLHAMTRHMLGLFAGQPGARGYRRVLSEQAVRPGAGLEVLDRAVACVGQAAEAAA
jgi:tRNA-dihydrouridine synthase A